MLSNTGEHLAISFSSCYLAEQRQNWLLVFDNLDDFGLIQIPDTGPKRHVSITTRNHRVRDGLKVFLLDKETACQLLLSEAEIDSKAEVQNEAGRIVDKLGFLPSQLSKLRHTFEKSLSISSPSLPNITIIQKNCSNGQQKEIGNTYKESVATTGSCRFQKFKVGIPSPSSC